MGWDLSAIPAGSTINSVTLTLTGRGAATSSDSTVYDVNLHELIGTALESGASWNNRYDDDVNDSLDVPWSTPGGDYNTTVLSSFSASPSTVSAGATYTFPSTTDFVAAAQSALDGSGTLYMLGIAPVAELVETEDTRFNFGSDDHSTEAYRPLLTVDYTGAPPLLSGFVIDRSTGNIRLKNNTGGPSDTMLAYSLTSDSGALNPSNWKSIAEYYDVDGPNGSEIASVDPNDHWTILTDTNSGKNTDLSEAEFDGGDGVTLPDGADVDLGNAWVQNLTEDVKYQILLDGGSILAGNVTFVGTPNIRSDLNYDSQIDVDDWVIFVANLETDLSGYTSPVAYQKGDLNDDGVNNHIDFAIFRGDYEAANGAGSFATMLASVPEPSSAILVFVCSFGLMCQHRCVR